MVENTFYILGIIALFFYIMDKVVEWYTAYKNIQHAMWMRRRK